MNRGGHQDRSTGDAAVICGIGHWLPPHVVTNADLCGRLDTSDEWIRKRTGISTRRVATDGMTTSRLAVEAGARALESAGGAAPQALVLATTTPDRPCPATAPDVAARLGLTGIAAFDVSAVCTGFLYGLATAVGFVTAGLADRVLLIAAETFTTLLDPHDRTTVPIFGDGAGAMVLRRGSSREPGAIGPMVLGSDGGHGDLIAWDPSGSGDAAGYFRMRGREVFRMAVDRMSEAAATATAAAGWRMDEVDWLVAHQANARILSAVGAELGIPPERRAQNIEDVGNTAGASIPILLAQATEEGNLAPDNRILLTAFGGGLTWGATTVVWPDLSANRRHTRRKPLYETLKSILVKDLELKEEDVRPEATLKEAGLDSLGMVELAMVLGKRYGAELTDDELTDDETVAGVAELLAQRAPSGLTATSG